MCWPADEGAPPRGDFAQYALGDVAAGMERSHPGWAPSPASGLFGGDPSDEGRTLAGPTPACVEGLADLGARAPHMAALTDLVGPHLSASSNIGLPILLPAALLLRPPGIGKMWCLTRYAHLIGVPFRTYAMTGQSLADGLYGSHGTWRNSKVGLVARALLSEPVANPLLFVDEIDKAGSYAERDAYWAFYDLLEPQCACAFRDEYLQFCTGASRVIWVHAGAGFGPLPEPILDRLTVVEVAAPRKAQARAVFAGIDRDLSAERRSFFETALGDDAHAKLVERSPRAIRRAVADAMTRAGAEARRKVRADDIPSPSRRAGASASSVFGLPRTHPPSRAQTCRTPSSSEVPICMPPSL